MFARTIAVLPRVGEGSLHVLIASIGNDAWPSSRRIAANVAIATKGADFGLAGVRLIERVLHQVSKPFSTETELYPALPLPTQEPAVYIHEGECAYRCTNDSPIHLLHGEKAWSTIHGHVAHGHGHTTHIHIHISLSAVIALS